MNSNKCNNRARVFFSLALILLTLMTGCAKLGIPSMPSGDKTGSSKGETKPGKEEDLEEEAVAKPDKSKDVITVVPNPDAEESNKEFINQLESLNRDLLLPLAFTVPDKVPTNAPIVINMGANYNLTPSPSWTLKTKDSDTLQLFHESGICVQFVSVKTKAKFEEPQISAELKSFYDSFVEKSEPIYKQAFIDTKLSGQEVSLEIPHNGKTLLIKAGAISKSNEVLVWTVNYYAESGSAAVQEELLATLFNTIQNNNYKVVLK